MNYAVLLERTIYHEGDERSRTHPGHGYPAYTEIVKDFKTFPSEDELKAWILTSGKNQRYQVIRYDIVKVKQVVNLELN